MTKNEIIDRILNGLLSTRNLLARELTDMSWNENSCGMKQMAIEKQIMEIDLSIDRRTMDLTADYIEFDASPIVPTKKK